MDSKFKIVVAEDQEVNIDVLSDHLQTLGAFENTEMCIDGQSTIDKCKQIIDEAISDTSCVNVTPIDLMLLDFQMPNKNGI